MICTLRRSSLVAKRRNVTIKPFLQALLLADQVYRAEGSGKVIIAGTYDCIYVTGFPTEFRETYLYVSLTDVHGSIPVKLEYVDWSNNEVLLEWGPIDVTSSNPIHSVDFSILVPPLPIPHEGTYALELFAENELIGMARVGVHLLEEEDDQNETEEDSEEENYS